MLNLTGNHNYHTIHAGLCGTKYKLGHTIEQTLNKTWPINTTQATITHQWVAVQSDTD